MPALEQLFEVVFEDTELLVINKPAGLVCHPTKTDEYSSLISRVRLYLGTAVRPQLINRLDRETSGLSFVAKNEQTARSLRRLWEQRQVSKSYLAIVHGSLPETHLSIFAPLGKDEHSVVAIKDCVRPDGAAAQTDVWLQATFNRPAGQIAVTDNHTSAPETQFKPFSLLRVVPYTGRKHQIRIHLAYIGHPIVGDKLYGGNEDLYLALVEDRLTPAARAELILPHHALHAEEVRFPWAGGEHVFRAGPEPWFKAFCSFPSSPG